MKTEDTRPSLPRYNFLNQCHISLLSGERGVVHMRRHGAVEDVVYGDADMDLDDSDFEPGADRELLGLFFPEVSI